MARPGERLGTPRSGGERQALSVLLTARRSAVNASTEAQLQLFSLVVAPPEPIRLRFHARLQGQKLAAMLNTAAKLRVQSAWDVETTSTVVAIRTLARRAHAMLQEARDLQKAILAGRQGSSAGFGRRGIGTMKQARRMGPRRRTRSHVSVLSAHCCS